MRKQLHVVLNCVEDMFWTRAQNSTQSVREEGHDKLITNSMNPLDCHSAATVIISVKIIPFHSLSYSFVGNMVADVCSVLQNNIILVGLNLLISYPKTYMIKKNKNYCSRNRADSINALRDEYSVE